jgi:hypothetical protein
MTKVGSSPASASTLATSEVVVVLPCVPAMAMPCFRRISSASITARGTTGTRGGARGQHLGVVGLDRGGHHHRLGAGDVRRVVADGDAHAQPARRSRGGAVALVAAETV